MLARLFLATPLNYIESAEGYDEKDLQKELSLWHPANDARMKYIPNRDKLLNLSVTERDSFILEYLDYVLSSAAAACNKVLLQVY